MGPFCHVNSPLKELSRTNMLHETKVLLDRVLPLQRAGQWHEAINLCREAFQRSVAERDVANLTEAILRAGFCYRHLGERELAAEYLDLGLTVAELHGDLERAGRALNGLATVHHIHGELAMAERCYSRAREYTHRTHDVQTSGQIDQNLGVLAVTRDDVTGGLEYYNSALACYRQVGHDRGIAQVLNNLGMLYVNLKELESAAACLDEALEVSLRAGEVVSEGVVHINRTELLLAGGDLERARESCDSAYEIVSQLGEHGSRADALRCYGIIYRETNKPYLAETHLREAIDVAQQHNYPLEEAGALRELSLVLRKQDRNREALEALNRAHELFNGLQAKDKQADIDKRLSQLESDFLALVKSWGESIEAKDRYTSGHCERVADYACRIAEKGGVPDRDMSWFRMGAFLHDVGKTEVPGEILNKPGRLTDEERSTMEQHTVIGDEMLSSTEFPWDIRPMVRSHHERWDGRGYPDSLAGEAIPFTARILRIADVFDALTTTRSYREPLTADQAFQLMEDDHGSFDPTVFEIFRELFPEFRKGIISDNGDHNSAMLDQAVG
jgi:putative nucleotidyltransferase with HDIG domain